MFKKIKEHEIGQRPELCLAVPHPNTELYCVKAVPDIIKSFFRPFCATHATNSTELRAGPFIRVPEAGDRKTIRQFANSPPTSDISATVPLGRLKVDSWMWLKVFFQAPNSSRETTCEFGNPAVSLDVLP